MKLLLSSRMPRCSQIIARRRNSWFVMPTSFAAFSDSSFSSFGSFYCFNEDRPWCALSVAREREYMTKSWFIGIRAASRRLVECNSYRFSFIALKRIGKSHQHLQFLSAEFRLCSRASTLFLIEHWMLFGIESPALEWIVIWYFRCAELIVFRWHKR